MVSGSCCGHCTLFPSRAMCVPSRDAMLRRHLDDRQWAMVSAFLERERAGKAGRPPKDNRKFIEAVLWWRRTGVPWRDLPEEFGPWKTVFNRFDRWSKCGRWSRLFQAVRVDVDDALGHPTSKLLASFGHGHGHGHVYGKIRYRDRA